MAGSGDPWIASHAANERLGQEIMEKISQYHQELARNTPKAPSLATSIRTLTKKFSSNTQALKQTLVQASTRGTITVREADRRQVLVDEMMSTEKRLEQAFNAKSTAAQNRSSLLGASDGYGSTSAWGSGAASTNPWLAGEEPEETRNVTSTDLRTQHQRTLEAQDRGLDSLAKIVGRQREIAVNINAEAEIHNDILDDIDQQMNRADHNVARETRNVKVILRKSRTHWCLWFLIVALLLSIVVVIAVPKPK